jgi:hydrogenase maturation protein HypF
MHPGYFSTQYAHSLKEKNIITIQHHWAHIASVLAEHNTDETVIGIVCDGTGYGTDGAIWGCECLIASLENFERLGHLEYYQLPGADKASKEAIRPVLSLLKKSYGGEFALEKFTWLLNRIEPDIEKQKIISEQLDKRINCIETSSLGRVFDAVAAMIGLGSYNNFDAQLPMALESIAAENIDEQYQFTIVSSQHQSCSIDLGITIKQIINDVEKEINPGIISAKFHNTLAAALLDMAKHARESTTLNTAVLSGGVFCNRYLLNRLIKLLKKEDFKVLFNREIPSNDGGISLGQAAIATKTKKSKSH